MQVLTVRADAFRDHGKPGDRRARACPHGLTRVARCCHRRGAVFCCTAAAACGGVANSNGGAAAIADQIAADLLREGLLIMNADLSRVHAVMCCRGRVTVGR